MSVTPITTHVADALDRLLEQYKKSPRLRAVISGLATEIQSVEDALNDVSLSRSIYEAEGYALDRIGATVGVVRPPDTADEIFRILIFGKISANVSQGETEAVIATYSLLTQATEVRLDEIFPASLAIYSNGTLNVSVLPYVALYLKLSVAAGVSVDSFGLFSEAAAFGFATDPSALGFGDANNPLVGGGLASQVG